MLGEAQGSQDHLAALPLCFGQWEQEPRHNPRHGSCLPPHRGHAPHPARRLSSPPLWHETKSGGREGSDFSGSDCGGGMSTHPFPDSQSRHGPGPSGIPSCLPFTSSIPLLPPGLAFCNWGRGKKEGRERERGRKRIWGTGWQADKERGRGGWEPGTRGRCQGLLGCGACTCGQQRASRCVCRGREACAAVPKGLGWQTARPSAEAPCMQPPSAGKQWGG